jgi:hypothetical protein
MWIMTQHGFVSAVKKKETDAFLTLRARDARSLAEVCYLLGKTPAEEIMSHLGSDYPYRIFLSPGEFVRYLSAEVEELDYSNFKDQITKTRGMVWHDALMDVWVAMLAVTPRARRQQRERRQRKRVAVGE